jgi:hypothetical protein
MKITDNTENLDMIVKLIAVVILAFMWPLAVIWALNQLQILALEYNFLNYLAVLVLSATIVRKGK